MDLYLQSGIKMMRKYLLPAATVLLFITQATVNAQTLKKLKDDEVDKSVKEMLNKYDKKIYFTQNDGQWPADVIYKADFRYGQAIATQKGMLVGTFDPGAIDAIRQQGDDEEEAIKNGTPLDGLRKKNTTVSGHGWLMNFVNSSASMKIETSDMHKEKYNYFFGNDNSKFSGNTNNYQEIWYKNVYDNVDVRYYPSESGTLEYDIVCKPGFNKNNIAIQFDGIDQMTVNDKGILSFKTSVGDVTFPEPVVYQSVNGKRVDVKASYAITKGNVLSFNLGKYDASLPLIIDPIALRWATWITNNSDGEDHGHGVWVDSADGSIYVLARIIGSGLITQNAFQNASAGSLDMVLGKYTEPATVGGSGVRVWQTYLGGSGDDNPYALEQGPDGNIYVTGYTSSSNFPMIGGSVFGTVASTLDARAQTTNNIFVTKINRAGNSIKSAVIGGNASEQSFDLRFDPSGDIVVGGYTSSTNLATQYSGSGASNTNNGGTDVLLFKIDSTLKTIRWMKNYGGSSNDQINIMNVKTNGDIYIGGTTSSSNFPLTSARQSTRGGTQSGILQKLNSSGAVQWSSYFSSASGFSAQILCMEFNKTEDTLYFAGLTTGLAAANISSGVVSATVKGGTDFFIAKMGIDQGFKAGTYLGGTLDEINMMGLNTDENNDVYIFGYTPSTDFPITSDALQSTNLGGQTLHSDKTFTKITSDLRTVKYSTYYGGTRDDYDPVGERGIKFSNCRIYTVVTSTSNDIPLTKNAVTTTRISTTYEPGLVVWANPPDFVNNSISPNQTVCPGVTPGNITGSLPSYLLPTIVRNSVESTYPPINGANTYQWQKSIDNSNWFDIPGATGQNLTGAQLGGVTQKTYIRRIIGGDACVIEQGTILYVNTLSVTGTSANTTCQGGKDGTITITPKDGTPGYTYVWSDGPTTQNRTGLGEGTYTVTIKDANNCQVVKTFTITYNNPKPDVTASAAPSTICQGNSTTLSFTGTAGVSVIGWFNNCSATGTALSTSTTLTVSPTVNTSYSVVVQTAAGCRDTSCVLVTVNTKPEVIASSSLPSVCRTQSAVLSFTPTTGITVVNWYLDNAAAGCTPTGSSLGANNTLTVNPAATTSYSVVVQTAAGCKDTACVTQTILDCFPEADRDLATTNEDASVTIPVLVNDTFGGNGPSTGAITITDNANHGTSTVNNGGTPNDPTDDQIVYTPNPNYNGKDTLIYQICDSDGDCDTAIVYITINPVNDLPTAVRDLAQGAEDSTITIRVLTNDTFGGDGPSTGAITITDNANHGTATVNNGGTPNDPTDDQITYTPNPNYNGNDTLIYQICDGYPTPGDCDTAIVYITIAPRNDLPTAVRDLAQGAEDSTITIVVLTNDTFGGDGPSTGAITITDNANHGTATVNNGGTPNDPTDDQITYTPNPNYNGKDTLIYQICDGYPTPGDCDTAIVYITIAPRNDLPTAVRDLAQGAEDSTITIRVLTNDTFGGDGPSTGAITITDNANHGTATVNNGGTPNDPTDDQITYTPNPNYNGKDTFIYQICDGYPTPGDCDTAIVYITIAPRNDLPTAVRDLAQGAEDSTITIRVLTNDTFGGDGPSTGAITITDNANHGTATVNNGGTPNDPTDDQITYTPNPNYNGKDTFIYQICDGYPTPGDCDTAIVYITIAPRNDLPRADRDFASVNEDASVTIPVLLNDTFGGDGPSTGAITITDNANHGTATVNNGGTPNDPTDDQIVYTPNPNYNGNDTLIYQICDGYPTPGDCDTAIVYIVNNPVNDPPVARNDFDTTCEDTPTTGNVATNDSDIDGPSVSISTVSGPHHGTILLAANGAYTYTPALNYNGKDTVVYSYCDLGNPNLCDTATLYILVTPVNDSIAHDKTVECDGSGNTAELALWLATNGGATAAGDSCYNCTWTNNFTGLTKGCGSTGSATVTFKLTYDCGTRNTIATFRIIDTIPPTITPAKNKTVDCDGSGDTLVLAAWLASNGGASASDICSGVKWSNDFTKLSDGCGATGSALVTFTATDSCGNATSTSATFTIIDTIPPTIDVTAKDKTVDCDGSGDTLALAAWLASNGGASASDICSGVKWSNDFHGLSDGCGATGSARVIFTATDSCGNKSTTSATFTIIDTIPPTIDITAKDKTVDCDGSGDTLALAAWLASNGGASASDICSGVKWSNDFTKLSDGCGATGSALVTFTATDSCGNKSTTSATFTIIDTMPPTIDVKAKNKTVDCDGSGNTAALQAWLASNGGASASDICSGVKWSNNFVRLSDGCGATGSARVTFTATDSCGNKSITRAVFTIIDTIPPTIDVTAKDKTVDCDGSGDTLVLAAWLASNGGASASDICSGVKWSNDFTKLSDGCGATGSALVTFTATDSCGNATSTSATFTIIDTIPPTIDVTAKDKTVDCDGSGNTLALAAWLASNGGASASDICSGVKWSNDFTKLSDGCGATGSALVTFTATDSCGNKSTTSATFTIIDTIPPTIDVTAKDKTVDCDGSGDTLALAAWLSSNGGASASDICSGVKWSNDFTKLSDGCGATGSALVTFTATDSCGNKSTTSATFTIIDTIPPTIDVTAKDKTVDCDGSGDTLALAAWLASNGGASASDICSGVKWSNDFTKLSDGCGATGSALVTFTATDSCGNATSTSATFTIIDTIPPTIDVTAKDKTVDCDGSGDTLALAAWLASNGGASASDICSGVKWSNDFTKLSDGCGATGSALVTFTATDSCGNATSTSATFTIIDTIPPTIDVTAKDKTVDCDGSGDTLALAAWLASNGGASASDICSGVKWSNDFTKLTDGCGATGSALVTFTATDSCGNKVTTSATFTIIDTIPPTIDVTAKDKTVDCDGSGNIAELTAWLANNGSASASDICSGVKWSNDFTKLTDGCGATGSALVTFTATDSCGNATSTSATFTIIDTIPPTIDVTAKDKTVDCDGSGDTLALAAWLASNGGASASDICSGVKWSNDFTKLSDGCGATGSALVTFTATDSCGNKTSTSATFTIIDTVPPTIDVTAKGKTVDCDGSGNIAELTAWLANNGGATASDICSGVKWSNDFTKLSDGCGATGSALVTFTATDSCGNTTSTSATFTIIDTIKPVFNEPLPGDVTVCDLVPNAAILTATDNCSTPVVTFTEVIDSVSIPNTKIYTRTWVATDDCNNSTTHVQHVTVNGSNVVTIERTICEGERVVIGSYSFGLTGNYEVTFSNANGCDSIVHLNLTVNPVKHTNVDAVICAGEQVVVGGQIFTTSVTNQVITLASSAGCDSIITLNLVVLKQDTILTERTICDGSFVNIGGHSYTASGVYFIPFQNHQCTGIVELHLTVNQPTQSTINRTVCAGDFVTVGGQIYSTNGVHTITIPNAAGCDSVITLNLTVNPAGNTTIDTAICKGLTVTVGSNVFNTTGTYHVTLTNAGGCDSNITLNLVTLSSGDTSDVKQSICAGDSAMVNGQVFTQAGTYYINSTNGRCNDVIALTLTVRPVSSTVLEESLCKGQSIVVGGQTFNATGTYTIGLQNSAGCDSIVTLKLNVSDGGSKSELDTTICEGGVVTYAGQTFTKTGTYQIVFPSGTCRDTLLLNLTVNPSTSITIDSTICENGRVVIGGHSFGLTGSYDVTLTNANGCDSFVHLNLTVNPVKHTDVDAVICAGEQVVVGGQIFTTSVTNQIITLASSAGCDSIITLNLVVLKQDTILTERTICDGDFVNIGGHIYTASGVYFIPFQNHQCTGIVELHLTVNQPTQSTINRTICAGDFIVVGGQIYSTNGVHTITIPNAAGCDSVITLNLTVNPISTTTIDTAICKGLTVTVGSNVFNTTGTYHVTLTNAAGCDSNITLNLVTLSSGDTSDVKQSICAGDSAMVNGQVFTQAGTYYINSTNGRCNDVIALTLTVRPISSTVLEESLCKGQSIVVGGQTFNATGTYTIGLQNSAGCDSIVTLKLNVSDGGSKSQLDTTICFGNSVTYAGQTFTKTGTYQVVFPSGTCRDTLLLNLTVNPTTSLIVDSTICQGETVVFGDKTFTQSGNYTIVVSNSYGCDSTITLNLTAVKCLTNDVIRDTDKITTIKEVCIPVEPSMTAHTTTILAGCGATHSNNTYTIISGTTCLQVTRDSTVGYNLDTLCIVVCDTVKNICDTTTAIFSNTPKPDTIIHYVCDTCGNDTICTKLPVGMVITTVLIDRCKVDTTVLVTVTSIPGTTCVALTIDSTLIVGIDTVCVVKCDASSGLCDTTVIIIHIPPHHDVIRDTNYVNTTDTVCVPVDPGMTPSTTTILQGCGVSHSQNVYTIISGTTCVQVKRDTTVGFNLDTLCIVVCDDIKHICDTTTAIFSNTEIIPPDTTPIITVDTIRDTTPIKTIIVECDFQKPIGDTLTVKACDGSTAGTAPHGTWTIDSLGCLVYTAGPLKGNDTLCINICDNHQRPECVTTTVIITVTGLPPVAVNDTTHTDPNVPVTIPVLTNDTTYDEDPLTLCDDPAVVIPPSHGTVTVNNDGTITYTPTEEYTGIDSFEYQICDPEGRDSAWVFITVSGCILPNAFSPNNDGVNDMFVIPCANGEVQFSVYNRWGIEVYRNDKYLNDWDGKYKGNPLPDGTYYYVLKYTMESGEEVNKAGFITLHR